MQVVFNTPAHSRPVTRRWRESTNGGNSAWSTVGGPTTSAGSARIPASTGLPSQPFISPGPGTSSPTPGTLRPRRSLFSTVRRRSTTTGTIKAQNGPAPARPAPASCIVPRRDGVFFGLEFRTHPWDKYATAAPAQRRPYGALSNTARKAYKA